MLLNVLPSESIHELVLPDLFIQDMEVVGSIIDRGIPLLYKLENGGRKVIVSARSYHEHSTVLIPREIMDLLNLEPGSSAVVSCSRHIARLPTLIGIVITPRNTDFYRSLDIRSLIEYRLMNVSVVHVGLQLFLQEGVLQHHVEITGLLTDDEHSGGSCTDAMVVAGQDVILDFAPNDNLLEIFNEEEEARKGSTHEVLRDPLLNRPQSFERIQRHRLSGGLVFGLSKEFYEYVSRQTSDHITSNDSSFSGKARTISD
jgi:hypothetical protein